MRFLFLTVACGARTVLISDGPDDAGFSDAQARDASDGSRPECRANVDCADTVGCSVDTCVAGRCTHVLDDSLCPPDGMTCGGPVRCSPTGCAHIGEPCRATVIGSVWGQVELPSGTFTQVGPPDVLYADIARHPNGTIYGVSVYKLHVVDASSGKALQTIPITISAASLAISSLGVLYAGAGNSLYTIDPSSGAVQEVAKFPSTYVSSGDLEFFGGALFGTARLTTGTDALVRFDLSSSGATLVGDLKYKFVFGLAAFNGDLYGFTGDQSLGYGEVILIDSATAQTKLIATVPDLIAGAASK